MTKGGKNQRKKKNSSYSEKVRELLFKDECQEYGLVTKLLGDCRCECQIFGTSSTVRGDIRGKMRGKVYINIGDFILMSKRDWDPTVYDIIHKYTPVEFEKIKVSEFDEDLNCSDDEIDGFDFSKV